MATSYTTIEPIAFEDFLQAFRREGFKVEFEGTPEWGSYTAEHPSDPDRAARGITPEKGEDGQMYAGCFGYPGLEGIEMIQSEKHAACGAEACGLDYEEGSN